MHVVLPKESHGRPLEFVPLKHPRTGETARFFVDKSPDAANPILELTRVGTAARSALVDNTVSSDGSVVVATPVHPLLLVLPSLWIFRERALPLDFLLEQSADETSQSIDPEMLTSLSSIATQTSGTWQLDLEKLKEWLDLRVQRLRAGLPPSAKQEVLRYVQPADSSSTASQELVDQAETYAASSMLATSWLAPELAEWYLETCDFALLLAEAERVSTAAELAWERDNPVNVSATKKAPAAKRVKSAPKNNTSILDMFKARPAKSAPK